MGRMPSHGSTNHCERIDACLEARALKTKPKAENIKPKAENSKQKYFVARSTIRSSTLSHCCTSRYLVIAVVATAAAAAAAVVVVVVVVVVFVVVVVVFVVIATDRSVVTMARDGV